MPASPAYHLWTIGCQMNSSDAARAASLLESAGFRPVEHARDADFLLLSTCVVRQQVEEKVLSRLKYMQELKRERPGRVVALMGCFVGNSGADQTALRERFPFVDLFLPPSDLSPLAAHLAQRAGLPPPPAGDAPDADPLPPSADSTVSAFLPVVLGCSHACSYCIIPYRRGPERSRPADRVLAEARALADRGVREITLLGQIIDRYGMDLPPSAPRLPELLRQIAAIPGLLRVRFLTSHPNWITPELVETVASTPKLMPYFEIPVQSGSDAVLEAMRRGYPARRWEDLVASIRDRIPGVGISTDLIVGFPGETEADFQASLSLMRRVDPDMIRVAKYSPRPTPPPPPARSPTPSRPRKKNAAASSSKPSSASSSPPATPPSSARPLKFWSSASNPPAAATAEPPTENPSSSTTPPPPPEPSSPPE